MAFNNRITLPSLLVEEAMAEVAEAVKDEAGMAAAAALDGGRRSSVCLFHSPSSIFLGCKNHGLESTRELEKESP